MRRREFILGVVGLTATWPVIADAQQSKAPVVGFLSNLALSESVDLVPGLRLGLREAGHVEGSGVLIDYRWAEGSQARLAALAADLVRQAPAVIVAVPTSSALVVKAATEKIPIVFGVGGDPVKLGLVSSLNRPAGNLTGVTFLGPDLEAKRLGLLHEMIAPTIAIAALIDPAAPNAEAQSRSIMEAGRMLGRQVLVLNARDDTDLEKAFASLVQQRAGAVVVTANGFFFNRRGHLIELAARHAMPSICEWRECAQAGGLISYGTRLVDSYHQMGVYAGRILNGERPADLPIMQPTKFELVINRKTAKSFGLEIPPKLLFTADEVIE